MMLNEASQTSNTQESLKFEKNHQMQLSNLLQISKLSRKEGYPEGVLLFSYSLQLQMLNQMNFYVFIQTKDSDGFMFLLTLTMLQERSGSVTSSWLSL